jgi:ornithine cyclodeaminase/alanine dehydrogenase-like protein (mu-crystallin family)
MTRAVRILRRSDVEAVLEMAACIDAVEAAFVAYSSGRAELPEVIHLDVPERGGEIHVKAGHLHGEPYYAVKVASGFAGGVNDGMVAVFDALDGSPAALLLDGGLVTDLRTGAAGGVAARRLAPSRVETVGVVGTGVQARRQIEAFLVVRPDVERVRVWGRDPAKAAARAEDLRALVPCEPAATVAEAVAGADVVITCTAARNPLVGLDMLAPGAHVTAVGSDGPGKHELDPRILAAADVLAVDSVEQCARLGELQHALAERSRAVELGEIAGGRELGRTSDAQLTVCDLTGVGVQDVAAANLVMRLAGGRGETIPLSEGGTF